MLQCDEPPMLLPSQAQDLQRASSVSFPGPEPRERRLDAQLYFIFSIDKDN